MNNSRLSFRCCWVNRTSFLALLRNWYPGLPWACCSFMPTPFIEDEQHSVAVASCPAGGGFPGGFSWHNPLPIKSHLKRPACTSCRPQLTPWCWRVSKGYFRLEIKIFSFRLHPLSFALQLHLALRKMSMMLGTERKRPPSCCPVSLPNCWNCKRLIGPLYIRASRNINLKPVAVSWAACSCYSRFSFSKPEHALVCSFEVRLVLILVSRVRWWRVCTNKSSCCKFRNKAGGVVSPVLLLSHQYELSEMLSSPNGENKMLFTFGKLSVYDHWYPVRGFSWLTSVSSHVNEALISLNAYLYTFCMSGLFQNISL